MFRYNIQLQAQTLNKKISNHIKISSFYLQCMSIFNNYQTKYNFTLFDSEITISVSKSVLHHMQTVFKLSGIERFFNNCTTTILYKQKSNFLTYGPLIYSCQDNQSIQKDLANCTYFNGNMPEKNKTELGSKFVNQATADYISPHILYKIMPVKKKKFH